MLGTDTIRSMQQDAAAQASRERRVPFVYWPNDNLGPPFPFPNLGDYVPPGWRQIDSFMADSSGFGADDEPAMTPDRLREHIEGEIAAHSGQTVGWAIVESGEFQVYIGEFLRDPGAPYPEASVNVTVDVSQAQRQLDEAMAAVQRLGGAKLGNALREASDG